MINDPYFNRVSMQLIQIPTSSRQALNAARESAGQIEPGFLFPVDSAKSWVKTILKDKYTYPPNTPFLPFPKEEGQCDVIRAVYKVDGDEIEIAQSIFLISIKVKESRSDSRVSNKERAEEIARRVFVMPDRMQFEEYGVFGSGTWGRQAGSSSPDLPPEPPNWIGDMRWWCSGDEVGFITIKASGPTKGLVPPTADANMSWFK